MKYDSAKLLAALNSNFAVAALFGRPVSPEDQARARARILGHAAK